MNNGLQTLFTGRLVTNLEATNSTNSFMSGLLAKNRLPEGSAVVALAQSAGRGQAGEQWISEPGKNLLMSFVFYPALLSVENLFMLSKAFSLGMYDCLIDEIKKDVKIKWPNDIYFQNRKLCGILIENSIRQTKLNHTILGIGLNVNQEYFPPELPNPVSLKMILEQESSLEDCFNKVCYAIENRYLQLKGKHYAKINEDYLNALFRFKEFHYYENKKEKFFAEITGIGNDGKIFFTRKNGFSEQYDLKEVKFVL